MASGEGKVSKCCGAAVRIASCRGDGVTTVSSYRTTLWHECTKCGKPCDIVSAQRVEGER